jgi:hypothetical protein
MQTRNASRLRESERMRWLRDTGHPVDPFRLASGRELPRRSGTMNEYEIDHATLVLTPARFSFVAERGAGPRWIRANAERPFGRLSYDAGDAAASPPDDALLLV